MSEPEASRRHSMGEMLPLFPLGAVLYPGMLLPLHIFEERYRQLVQDLLEGPEPRRFGVIAIRKGRETGIDGVNGLKSLYEIGCTATLRRVDRASADAAVRVIQAAFREYLDALTEWGGATVRIEDLPDEPGLLSFIVAAAMVIDLPQRQALLAESDTLRRLAMQRALLSRETAMLRTTTSRPAPDLRHTPYSPN